MRSASRSGPPAVTEPRSSLGTILRGGMWQTLGQLVPLIVNLALTPFIIHGLGLARYGLYMYVMSLSAFVASFDGGLNVSTQRHFSIFAGRDDRVETTRLLTTLLCVVTVICAGITATLWFIAVPVSHILRMPVSLRPEAVFLVRVMGCIVGTALLRNLPVAVLIARQRFLLININTILNHGVYVAGMILTIDHGWRLYGVAGTLIAQQLVSTVMLLPQTVHGLSRKGVGLYSWTELKAFLNYSGKVQVSGVAKLVLNEFDSLLLGVVMPIRFVGIYSAGASFATQLQTVPQNAAAPIMSVLGHRFGRDGEEAMLAEFRSLQRLWVLVIAGWCAAGAGAALFAIGAWLGPTFNQSGIVAAITLVGSLFYVLPDVMIAGLGIVGRPGLQARYGVVMVIVNVGLTIPLVFTGPIGVAAATMIGQIVASIFLIRIVRKRWRPDVPNYLAQVPRLATAITIATVIGLEVAIHPIVPRGAAGLLLCAVPGAVGLGLFARLALGRHPIAAVRDTFAQAEGQEPDSSSPTASTLERSAADLG